MFSEHAAAAAPAVLSSLLLFCLLLHLLVLWWSGATLFRCQRGRRVSAEPFDALPGPPPKRVRLPPSTDLDFKRHPTLPGCLTSRAPEVLAGIPRNAASVRLDWDDRTFLVQGRSPELGVVLCPQRPLVVLDGWDLDPRPIKRTPLQISVRASVPDGTRVVRVQGQQVRGVNGEYLVVGPPPAGSAAAAGGRLVLTEALETTFAGVPGMRFVGTPLLRDGSVEVRGTGPFPVGTPLFFTDVRAFAVVRSREGEEFVASYEALSDPTPSTEDTVCAFNSQCPYFMADSTYPNFRGGCQGGGYCEMPVGVQNVGYRGVLSPLPWDAVGARGFEGDALEKLNAAEKVKQTHGHGAQTVQ
jgi:hypothetical protein